MWIAAQALPVPTRAEDFSEYQKKIPGMMYWLGVGNNQRGITAGLHTAEYDVDENCLVTGVIAMTCLLERSEEGESADLIDRRIGLVRGSGNRRRHATGPGDQEADAGECLNRDRRIQGRVFLREP